MRLIDADALMNQYERIDWYSVSKSGVLMRGATSEDNPVIHYYDGEEVIEDAPTIEADPVRHGRWVIEKRHSVSRNPYMDDNYFASATCSECDFCIHAETKSFGYPDLNTTNYCPNCGARMDGDANDEG